MSELWIWYTIAENLRKMPHVININHTKINVRMIIKEEANWKPKVCVVGISWYKSETTGFSIVEKLLGYRKGSTSHPKEGDATDKMKLH